MPPTIVLLIIAVLVTIVLAHGYRTLTALLVLRSLPSDTDMPSSIVDGETVALTGELTVEEPVETASAAVEDADRPVGAYLWQSRFSDNTNSDLTIEDWGWERQHWHTFASGIEWGRFGVDAGSQTVRIDPSWLRTALDAERLAELEIGGVNKHDRLSVYLWDSWYTYLRDRIEHRSFQRFAGYVQRHNDEIDLDRYLLEARPLLEGDEVSISGEIHVEQGEPVLRGTDDVPLLLSDNGFDEHRRWLKRRALQKGAFITGLLVVAVSLWFEFYIPLGILVVGWLLYWAYHFVQDAGIFLEWIRS
ncbi:hypothetical protein [Halostagnicola kamekurae]|uniref:Uncharacterized protein n=1 Tax=Halostagnicola kamekurae TaxID=619731 RepID=A0A1I6TSP2_9EURY|nr:hypothetical protein [Halostagnicola kamekurae]SFS92205.1 hypothetical protein SAMN04488556_3392 [Halostagnicola kamekurae]